MFDQSPNFVRCYSATVLHAHFLRRLHRRLSSYVCVGYVFASLGVEAFFLHVDSSRTLLDLLP